MPAPKGIQPTSIIYTLLKLIENEPGLNCRELAAQLDIDVHCTCGMLSALKNKHKLIYISGWRRDEESARLYPRALYSVGQEENAKKPGKLKKTTTNRRHNHKRRSMVTSVFDLGKPRDERRLTTRKRPDVTAKHAEQPLAHAEGG